eukprot:GCRY01001155.1.p1 GENE.GCRY01001155.1~~GCRY01001155.1.p1  ORF type:complete len:469 (-),score=50.88 GCRY01001155.1:147-1553(-)
MPSDSNMKIFFLFIFFLLFAQGLSISFSAAAQSHLYEVEIGLTEPEQLSLLEDIDIDGRAGSTFFAHITQKEHFDLLAKGFQVSRKSVVLEDELSRFSRDSSYEYHHYDSLTHFLHDLNKKFPNMTTLFNIGKTLSGRDTWGIEISVNPGQAEKKPSFYWVANIHGDESVGREMSLLFAEHLLENYALNSTIKELVDETKIFIIPSANPDGFERHRRYNSKGVDLNRNFPDFFKGDKDSANGRQPETVNLMDFVANNGRLILSASLHGGALVACYPYDGISSGRFSSGKPSFSPDNDLFVELALLYSRTHATMSNSREFDDGIINGADWYTLYGGLGDWGYHWHQVSQLTLELSNTKWPSASSIPHYWDQNRDAMVALTSAVHMNVHGEVVNSVSNQPLIGVTVTVEGNTHETYTLAPFGDFYRLLVPGTYTLQFSHAGYEPYETTVTLGEDRRGVDLGEIKLKPQTN